MTAKKRARPLSITMRRMLRAVRDHGDHLHGVHGQSEHGGADGTLRALLRRKLLAIVDNEIEITEAGRAAIFTIGSDS